MNGLGLLLLTAVEGTCALGVLAHFCQQREVDAELLKGDRDGCVEVRLLSDRVDLLKGGRPVDRE